jgi:TPR repeat protein
MKRTVVALLCIATLIAWRTGISGAEDSAADKDMARVYLQAAQNGDAHAQFYLGALVSNGVGLLQSDTEAFQWFSRAAEQGHTHAILILSGLYSIGRGTAKSNVNAYKWASIAASRSRVDDTRTGARQLLSVLESKMSPFEIEQAKSQAESWRPSVPRTQ